jgi:hypothetical protein
MGTMGMLRCPTCLTLLDGGEARCPACRTRLRKRSQPIVLGEATRIASRPQLQADREVRQAAEATHAEARRRRRVAEATHRSPADSRPVTPRPSESPEFVAELVWTPEAPATPEPAAFFARVDAQVDAKVDLEPEPEIAAALAPETDVRPSTEIPAFVVDEPEPEDVVPAPIFNQVEREPVVPAQFFSRTTDELGSEPARRLLFTSITPPPVNQVVTETAPLPDPAPAPNPRFGLFDLTADDVHDRPREQYRPTPSRSRRFIDLTSQPDSEPVIDLAPEHPRSEQDVHEMFGALQRKARSQDRDTAFAAAPVERDADRADNSMLDLDAYAKPPTSRALRLTAARSNRRRRWSAEFRGHRAASDD